MATSLLYLGPCLGPYSILVTAGLGGIYIYSCYSCYGCYRVAGAAIRVAGGIAIEITYSAAVGIAGGIGGSSYEAYYGRSCIDRAYIGGACADGASIDGAYADGAFIDGACTDGAYTDGACGMG
jgi:hypothetical protein